MVVFVTIDTMLVLSHFFYWQLIFLGAQAAGNAAAAVASGQPDTAIEHTDYRNKLTEIRILYHQEVSVVWKADVDSNLSDIVLSI